MKKIAKFYLLTAWAFFIIYLLTAPMPELQGMGVTYYDKFIHAFMFGVLAYFVFAFFREFRIKASFLAAVSFTLAALYSAFGEFAQAFAPGRDASELDFLAGAAGALLATIFLYVRYKDEKA